MEFYKEIALPRHLGQDVAGSLQTHKVVCVRASGQVPGEDFWREQAEVIGQLVPTEEDRDSGNKTGNLFIDIKYDPAFPDRFIHSNTRQPLHTDGSYESNSPDVSFFHCIRGADIGGATTFLDLPILVECLRREEPGLLGRLRTEPLLFFKGTDSKRSLVLDGERCNWNYFRAEKCDLSESLHRYLEGRIVNMGLTLDVRLRPGDAVFFRDELLMHGRHAFIGPRWLKKGGIRCRSGA